MLSDLRIEIPAAAAALLAAVIASACSSTPTCTETATCPPNPVDAQAEHEASDVDDAGSYDAETDVSVADDGSGRADGTDGSDAADASKDADVSLPSDASSDWRASDGSDATSDQRSDGAPDAAVCDIDAGRSPTDNPCIVSERYGVFVSPSGSDATGAGTRGAPYKTINRGLQAAKAETMRIFVCDNGTGYADPISIDSMLDGLSVFGGFDCSTWALAASARTRVRPPAGPALIIEGLTTGVTLENFELIAPDAAIGASSIAVRIKASQQVVLRRTRIVAGKGGAGADGVDGAKGSDGDPVGADQQGRAAQCNTTTTTQPGTLALTSACGSKGGEGGGCDSLVVIGYPGTAGLPMQGVDPPDRQNGGTICLADCHGKRGSDGVAGGPGSANAQGGALTAEGYTPALPGGDGTPGHVAQGGGGGAGTVTDFNATGCVGATGGAGGLGGCGGGAGAGGRAGGASIALLSWTSGVILDACSLESADGGRGGHGGNGAIGGIGAQGGIGGERYNDGNVAIFAGGNGGLGGTGGPGGGGAGGNGGPSYGIVYAGGRPSQIGGTTVVRGAGGAKGLGGFGGVAGIPDGGVADGSVSDGSASPDAGGVRAADGLPGDAAYELVIP